MLLVAGLLLAHVAGFVAPGLWLARLLDVRPRWCGAFVLSWLSLVLGTILFQVVGVPLRAGPMLAWQLAVTAVAALARARTPVRDETEIGADERALGARQRGALFGLALLSVALLLWRGALAPLAGFDTLFRWDFLARQMLAQRSLDFYPPVSAADYSLYFYPDGMAPLVSAPYWWIYALAGRSEPALTTVFVAAQWAVALGFTARLATTLGGRAAGWWAVGTLAGSEFLWRAVAAGQEIGATTLALVGTLAVLAETRRDDVRRAVAAGLIAGSGALAREYGGVFAVAGLLLLAWRPRGRRVAFTFVATAALVAAPWYLRNFVRCGHPFHTLPFPGFAPAAPVYAELLEVYRSLLAPWRQPASVWRETGLAFLRGMPLALAATFAAAPAFARRAGFLPLASALLVALWLHSVSFTCGGMLYAARVAAPIAAVGAVLFGMAAARWARSDARRSDVRRNDVRRNIVTGLVALAGAWGLVRAASFPYELPLGKTLEALVAPYEMPAAVRGLARSAPQNLPSGARILAEDAYAHALLAPQGIDVVPIWSPEVAFAFDGKTSATAVRAKLRELGIRFVLLSSDSPNNAVCLAQPFWKEDLPRWLPIAESAGSFTLFAMPE